MLALQSALHGNHLHGALLTHERQKLARDVMLVRLGAERVLRNSGQHIYHTRFPTTAVISLMSTAASSQLYRWPESEAERVASSELAVAWPCLRQAETGA
jgi:hypothetical protein